MKGAFAPRPHRNEQAAGEEDGVQRAGRTVRCSEPLCSGPLIWRESYGGVLPNLVNQLLAILPGAYYRQIAPDLKHVKLARGVLEAHRFDGFILVAPK